MNYKFRKLLYEDAATNNSFEERVAYAKQQLQNGADPKDVFDFVDYDDEYSSEGLPVVVRLGDKCNFIKPDGNLLSDNLWFDSTGDFYNMYSECSINDYVTPVELDGKYNFIKINGQLLSKRWFDDVDIFCEEGFAMVELDDKCNFINTNGQLLSKRWFDDAVEFHNGFAQVYLDNRGWNFLKPDGNFLREDLWFDNVESFHDGFDYAWADLNGKNYKIDTNGNLYDEKGNPIDKVNENRRRTVRLTESQLRNTIKRVVAQCLKEGRRR